MSDFIFDFCQQKYKIENHQMIKLSFFILMDPEMCSLNRKNKIKVKQNFLFVFSEI
jgi:hypothetical protein